MAGRPKTNEPIRKQRLVANMTPKEIEEAKRKAKARGLKVAEYIRYLIKSDRV